MSCCRHYLDVDVEVADRDVAVVEIVVVDDVLIIVGVGAMRVAQKIVRCV